MIQIIHEGVFIIITHKDLENWAFVIIFDI